MATRRTFLLAALAAFGLGAPDAKAQWHRPPPPPRHQHRPPPPRGPHRWHWHSGRWRWHRGRWVWDQGRWRW